MDLEKIAFAVALAGTALLLFLSFQIQPELIPASKITYKLIDENVKVQGEIVNLKETEKVVSFDILDNSGKIRVFFYREKESVKISEGMILRVTGKVQEYMGVLELEAGKIEVVR